MVSFSLIILPGSAEIDLNGRLWKEAERNLWVISTILHDVSALIVSFISRLLFSLSSSFCPYRAESRVCILRGVSYCKCRLPVMLWGPWPVWTLGHKKIIVSDPDIYDQPGQVPPWWCGAPSSSDVTLATSFYHQPVFMFMGNSQILPQITVWRPINFWSNIWVGWKLLHLNDYTSFSHMDHKTWATSWSFIH